MTENQWKIFVEIHDGLPREGPGGDESTRIAWSCIRNIPERPRILDIGCGPGAQTVCLADISKGEIHAIDNNAAFVDQLKKSMADRGVGGVIHPLIADRKQDRHSYPSPFAISAYARGPSRGGIITLLNERR
ncbi:MAG: class I SAM-dependent methyltransferase [Spirochaetia bacterium]|jgi:predicted RNA methylase